MLQYFCQMNRFFYIRFDDVWNWVDCFASIATRKKKKDRFLQCLFLRRVSS